jgi:SH3-like domain-containing protein
MGLGRFCSVVVLAACLLGASAITASSAKDSALTSSGLPVPRYVSLKSDHVNVRAGPTKDNDVAWVYTRSGLPVEITAEFENWRRVRDSEGAEGWVYHSLLSGRRTAVITMKSKPASWPRSNAARPAGATSAATASMAGSSSSGCGASTPTRGWTDFGALLHEVYLLLRHGRAQPSKGRRRFRRPMSGHPRL